jgi:DNA-binding NarL/FixJ family response regulator
MLGSEPGISIVAEARAWQDAVGMARETRADVAVADVRDPRAVDLKACQGIHAQGGGCHLLMLLAHTDEETILDLLLDGASGYLFDDLEGEELCAAVRTLHRGGSPLDPQIAGVLSRRLCLHSAGGQSPLAALTGHDLDILTRIVRGETNHQIGCILHLPDQVVKHRVSDILKKIHAKNRVAAAAWWAKQAYAEADLEEASATGSPQPRQGVSQACP